jgi:hypothetical protein
MRPVLLAVAYTTLRIHQEGHAIVLETLAKKIKNFHQLFHNFVIAWNEDLTSDSSIPEEVMKNPSSCPPGILPKQAYRDLFSSFFSEICLSCCVMH